jgi:hypothetical protein
MKFVVNILPKVTGKCYGVGENRWEAGFKIPTGAVNR